MKHDEFIVECKFKDGVDNWHNVSFDIYNKIVPAEKILRKLSVDKRFSFRIRHRVVGNFKTVIRENV